MGSFLNAEHVGRINALFKRAGRYDFTEHIYDFCGVMGWGTEEELFKRIRSEGHGLHNILPPVKHSYCELRNRGRYFVLPLYKYKIYKKSFIQKSLYTVKIFLSAFYYNNFILLETLSHCYDNVCISNKRLFTYAVNAANQIDFAKFLPVLWLFVKFKIFSLELDYVKWLDR